MSKTLLIILFIVLAVLILANIMLLACLIFKLTGKKKSIKQKEKFNLASPWQTDFLNQSSEHAEKILFGKVFIQEYGEPQYFGNKLLDVISKLNDETKIAVVIAMKSTCLSPDSCRTNEQLFRAMAEQEKVPAWFIILREAVKKVVPEFFIEQPAESKIVSIYTKIA